MQLLRLVVLPLAMVYLASQSADDMAPIRVAGFGYIEHAMFRWTNSQIEFRFSTNLLYNHLLFNHPLL